MEWDSEVINLPKVAKRILDRASGKSCQRRCRAMASENIYGLLIASGLTVLRYREDTLSSQRQTCRRQCGAMTKEHVYGNGFLCYQLNKAALRILDRANGPPWQRQYRAMASEHICGLLMGSVLTAQSSIGNTRSSQRQTLIESVSDDGKWVYSRIVNGKLRSCLKLHREYSIEPTANPIRDRVGRWKVNIFVDC